jgi:hypothetical protein
LPETLNCAVIPAANAVVAASKAVVAAIRTLVLCMVFLF